jgi:hypothetical protein
VQFCLRVGEDGGATCTGGPALEVVGKVPELDWDRSSELVWVASGMFEVEIDGRQVRQLRPVDLPDEVSRLVEQRAYRSLIQEYPEWVASPELFWLAPDLLKLLPPDRLARVPAVSNGRPLESFEPYEAEFAREFRRQFSSAYFETTYPEDQSVFVVLVPHSASSFVDGLEAIRARSEEDAPELLVVSFAVRLEPDG